MRTCRSLRRSPKDGRDDAGPACSRTALHHCVWHFREPAAPDLEDLDNGVLRVGLSRQHGGSLAYLSRSGEDDNLVNVPDLGGCVQQSYYSGPKPFLPEDATMHPGWPGLGWNPIQAGDVHGKPPGLLSLQREGDMLQARCVPMQWALDGVAGDCVLETRVRLDANRVHLAPLHTELLDHDIVYEARVTQVVGDLQRGIRVYAKSQRFDPRPRFEFAKDRAHCVPIRLQDDAPPYEGSWRLSLDQDDPHIVTAPVHYDAKQAPKLCLRAAHRTEHREGELCFAPPGGSFDRKRYVTFRIKPDGQMRTYEIDLSRNPLHTGVIGQLRLDPVVERVEGDRVDPEWLRAQK